MLKKTEEWINDCLKGAAGALVATFIFALLHYIGSHIPQIWEYLSQFATATTVIKIARK